MSVSAVVMAIKLGTENGQRVCISVSRRVHCGSKAFFVQA